jgi:nucleoside-diphosphate-sugar epimerase
VRAEDAAAALAAAGADPVRGDLRDGRAAAALAGGADAVVHLAAAFDEPSAHAVNVEGTRTLAEAATAAGVGRFVFAGTNLVYPAGLGRPAGEDDPLAPDPVWGAYARTKALADRELRELRDLEVVVLRLAFVYGERDPHLREALRWASRWAGHRRFQMVHHADVAQAVIRTLDAPGVAGRAYNVGDLAPVTAVELHQVLGEQQPTAPPADPDGDLWHAIVDTRRIRRELGFQPLFPSVWTAFDHGAL